MYSEMIEIHNVFRLLDLCSAEGGRSEGPGLQLYIAAHCPQALSWIQVYHIVS